MDGAGRCRLIAVLALLSTAFPLAPAAAGADCPQHTQFTHLRSGLTRTTLRLSRHEPLTIVAMGSSSTAGAGASAPARSYPSRLADALRRRAGPGQEIRVFNRGIGGETADGMLARFDRDIFAAKPDLVIWQVGTNAVLHDMATIRSDGIIRRGIDRLKAAKIDVVLMDLQYAPQVLAHPLYRQMEATLATIAKTEGVPLFRRFGLMEEWVQTDGLGFTAVISRDGLHMNDRSYDCLGRMLADAILDSTAPATYAAHR